MRIMTFKLNDIDYGIPIGDVEFVDGNRNDIVKFPDMPPYIKGIMKIRGCVVPVYSFSSLFGYMENEHKYLVVVHIGKILLGFEVDRMEAGIDINENEIFSMPILAGRIRHYFKGVVASNSGRLLFVIDINCLITQKEAKAICCLIEDDIQKRSSI